MDFVKKVPTVPENHLIIFVLGIICVVAMGVLGAEAKGIVNTFGGGLIGYMSKSATTT